MCDLFHTVLHTLLSSPVACPKPLSRPSRNFMGWRVLGTSPKIHSTCVTNYGATLKGFVENSRNGQIIQTDPALAYPCVRSSKNPSNSVLSTVNSGCERSLVIAFVDLPCRSRLCAVRNAGFRFSRPAKVDQHFLTPFNFL